MTDVLIDARRGAGSNLEILYGTVTWKPTLTHSRGTSVVLPAPTTYDLVDGQVVATNVQPTPEPVEGQIEWAYEVTFKDRHSKSYSFLVGVPDSTSQVNFISLPRYFETKPPLFGQGPQGDPGEAATVAVGSVTGGATAQVSNSGTNTDAVLDFVLPKGDKGDTGVGVPAGGSALQYVRKNSGNTATEWATLSKASVGLSNVNNTSDANKPVSTQQQGAIDALEAKTDSNVADLLSDSESLVGVSLTENINNQVPPIVEEVLEAPADSTSYIDSIKVLCTFPMYDLDTTRAYMQGFSINKADNEIYVNIGGGSYGFQRIEVRDLTTGERKSYRELSASLLSYTEGMPWWKEANGDLKFIVRLLPSAPAAQSYQIYNYTTDNLSVAIPINGKVRGDVNGDFYVTNDAYGTNGSQFWVYDWPSVKAGAPILLATYPMSNAGPTLAKVQGIATTGDSYYVYGGNPSESPTVTAYDWDGRLRFGRKWSRAEFAKAVNADRPGTITLATYEWEAEGATNLDGRLVTAHVVGNGTYDSGGYIRTVIIVQHGVVSGPKMTGEPVTGYVRDTGWVDATYLDGYTYSHPNRRLQYRVRDGVVYWKGSVKAELGDIPQGSYVQIAEAPPTSACPPLPLRTEIGDTVAHGFAAFERNQPVKVFLRVTSTETSISPAPFLNT